MIVLWFLMTRYVYEDDRTGGIEFLEGICCCKNRRDSLCMPYSMYVPKAKETIAIFPQAKKEKAYGLFPPPAIPPGS